MADSFSIFKSSKYTFDGKKPYENVIHLLYRHWFVLLGKILALANFPSFNPNQYSKEKDENFVRGFFGRMLFSGEEVFKIIGQLMIKSTKEKIVEELKNKEKLLEIRLKTLEKQELSLSDQLEGVRDEILSQKKPEKKK